MPELRIRRLDLGTAGIAASLHATSGKSVNTDAMREFLTDPSNWFLAAFLDGRATGYLYGYLVARPDQPRPRFLLYDLKVTTTRRRQGLATALVETLHGEMTKLHARIFLITQRSNEEAMAFYKSIGAVERHGEDVMLTLPR
jgi:ribosomal protein S18 acetylase RimI-like enzyme